MLAVERFRGVTGIRTDFNGGTFNGTMDTPWSLERAFEQGGVCRDVVSAGREQNFVRFDSKLRNGKKKKSHNARACSGLEVPYFPAGARSPES